MIASCRCALTRPEQATPAAGDLVAAVLDVTVVVVDDLVMPVLHALFMAAWDVAAWDVAVLPAGIFRAALFPAGIFLAALVLRAVWPAARVLEVLVRGGLLAGAPVGGRDAPANGRCRGDTRARHRDVTRRRMSVAVCHLARHPRSVPGEAASLRSEMMCTSRRMGDHRTRLPRVLTCMS
jgi:hypothetical protein